MTPTAQTAPKKSRLRARLLGALTLLAGVFLPGCSGEKVVKLEDYLEELEFERPLEAMSEIKVKSYRFPCAARHRNAVGADQPPMWVQMKFDLYVIAAEEDKSAVLAAIERHRGLIDDTVLTICRRSSIDQLQDSNWNTIRTRLIDALRPLLGQDRIRQVIFEYAAPWEPI